MTDTIKLGDREFKVEKFTLRTVKDIATAMEAPADTMSQIIDRATGIVTVAVRHVDPSLSSENIEAMTVTVDELEAAVVTIMRVAGFARAVAPEAAGDVAQVDQIAEPAAATA